MTRLILFIVSGMLLLAGGSAFSKILKVKCMDVKTNKELMQQFNFDLKNKFFTTLLDNKIDIAFTDNEIIFQSYFADVNVLSFEMNRETGKGFLKGYDYKEFSLIPKDNLLIESAHSLMRYPKLSNEDRALFTIRDYARKYLKPNQVNELQCSKL
jgi:hypothetical protein